MKTRNLFLLGMLVFAMLIAGCSSPTPTTVPIVPPTTVPPTKAPAPAVEPTKAPVATPVVAATNFTDAFAYCSTVGNMDVPDARYTGAKMPDNVLTGLITAAKVSATMPKDVLAQQSFWRCMNNKVYACMVGANLPCQEKADTNKTPAAALNDYCKANPSAATIPAVVTGRATVYDWKCVSGKPEVAKEVFKADARGFIADFWYEIAPSAASNPGSSMANPASTYCVQNGGKSEIRKDAKGGEVGYCVFADKSECEEWAYMRGECKAGAKPTNVTKADKDKTINVALNGVVVVTLEGNATTGYAWALESGNDKVLKAQGDPKYNPLPAAPGMVGTGGAYEFRFNAVGVGTATLKFIHKQPWVQSDPKAETFSVTVNVK